jgi:hypothetical protein
LCCDGPEINWGEHTLDQQKDGTGQWDERTRYKKARKGGDGGGMPANSYTVTQRQWPNIALYILLLKKKLFDFYFWSLPNTKLFPCYCHW